MLYQYDPKQVAAIVGGNIIGGFTDGTFIVVERNEDAFNLKVGVDGIGTRAKTNNKSGKVTFTLHQSSPSNDVLSALALTDENTGAGAVPFSMRDASGSSVAGALTVWIKRVANAEFAKEVSNRVWVLETEEINIFNGGNSTPPAPTAG